MKPNLSFSNLKLYYLLGWFGLLLSASVNATAPLNHSEPPPYQYIGGKLLLGELELVQLSPPTISLEARIDSGAHTSSLDARDIEVFQRNTEYWVRFVLVDRRSQKPYLLERPLVRWVQIKQASSQQTQKRAVIQLDIQLGDSAQTAEFSLVDRAHLNAAVLVGRNVLQHGFVVDVSQRFIAPLPEIQND